MMSLLFVAFVGAVIGFGFGMLFAFWLVDSSSSVDFDKFMREWDEHA